MCVWGKCCGSRESVVMVTGAPHTCPCFLCWMCWRAVLACEHWTNLQTEKQQVMLLLTWANVKHLSSDVPEDPGDRLGNPGDVFRSTEPRWSCVLAVMYRDRMCPRLLEPASSSWKVSEKVRNLWGRLVSSQLTKSRRKDSLCFIWTENRLRILQNGL